MVAEAAQLGTMRPTSLNMATRPTIHTPTGTGDGTCEAHKAAERQGITVLRGMNSAAATWQDDF